MEKHILINPWKEQSKINPQREDGNRQISNCLFKHLMKAELSGSEFRIVMAIIDKTWGYNKKSDCISISKFKEATGLGERTIHESIKVLKQKKVIHYEPGESVYKGSPINEFMFNKHYDTWETGCVKKFHSKNSKGCGNPHGCGKAHPLTEDGDIPESARGAEKCMGAEKCILGVRKSAPTIRNNNKRKKNISSHIENTPEYLLSNSNEIRLSTFFIERIRKNKPNFKQPDINKWAEEFDKLIRIDKHSPREIAEVIKWAQEDSFWWANVLSPSKIRKQWETLTAQKLSSERRINNEPKIIQVDRDYSREALERELS